MRESHLSNLDGTAHSEVGGGSWHCHYLVSDGAKALLKSAASGLGCVHVPDLFHALRGLGRPFGQAIARQAATLQKQQERVQQQRAKSSEVSETSPLQAVFERNAADQRQIQQDQQTYQQTLEHIGQSLHPSRSIASNGKPIRDY